MANEIIYFTINPKEFIEFGFSCSHRDISVFDFVTITYHKQSDERYMLFDNGSADTALVLLEGLLSKAIADELKLDSTIDPNFKNKDLGYLYSIYMHKLFSDEYENISDEEFEAYFNKDLPKDSYLACAKVGNGPRKDWIGFDYQVWSPNRGNPGTWLYNKDNKILLEFTSSYEWHGIDPEESEKFIPYKEFMQNYKPLLITEISKETAGKWLIKTRELLNTIDTNTLKLRPGCSRP